MIKFVPIEESLFKEKLKNLVLEAHKKVPRYDFYQLYPDHETDDKWLEIVGWLPLPAQIISDFQSEIKLEDTVASEWDPDTHVPEIKGIHTLPNGMTYFGLLIGGEAIPIFCIIYWDGENLRGYTPTEGNCYNKKTKAIWLYYMGDEDFEEEYFKIFHQEYSEEVEEEEAKAEGVDLVTCTNFSFDSAKIVDHIQKVFTAKLL